MYVCACALCNVQCVCVIINTTILFYQRHEQSRTSAHRQRDPAIARSLVLKHIDTVKLITNTIKPD